MLWWKRSKFWQEMHDNAMARWRGVYAEHEKDPHACSFNSLKPGLLKAQADGLFTPPTNYPGQTNDESPEAAMLPTKKAPDRDPFDSCVKNVCVCITVRGEKLFTCKKCKATSKEELAKLEQRLEELARRQDT